MSGRLDITGPSWLRARSRAAAWRLRCELLVWRRGAWWLFALAMGLAAAWLWTIERVDLQRRAAEAARAQPPASFGAEEEQRHSQAEDAQRLNEFRAVLPLASDAAEQVQRLVELTRQDLAWKQAEFLHSEDRALGLKRMQINVPVAGAYPRLRAAIDEALHEVKNLSLDQVVFQRQSTGDTQLQARVRFSLWLAAGGRADDVQGRKP